VIAARLSDATIVVIVIAAFIVVLALIATGRSLFTRTPPRSRRFRVGVFIERDHEAGTEYDATERQEGGDE
jgi:hypothetical protein